MQKTILIAEDYPDIRAMMRILVRRYGYRVIEASDGYEAVEKARQYHPDLILMDLAMPIMDGVTAAKIIKQSKDFEKVPILALTAYADSLKEKAIRAGIDKVIKKPLRFDKLKPLLSEYLS